MKRYPKIRRIARVEIPPAKFIECVHTVQRAMREFGTRDPRTRVEMIGGFFGDEEMGMAFVIRMECMMELHSSPKAAPFVVKDANSTLLSSSLGMFHAAALAPIHYDDDRQYFDEDEFFAIAELENGALIAAGAKDVE